jgi:hypothetical protein
MNTPLIVEEVVASLSRRYGKFQTFGRSRMFAFGSSLGCSINYSKLLGGHKYFFGVSREVVDPAYKFPETKLGEFVLLVCGAADNVLVLPRDLVLRMMRNVASRRVDVFREGAAYILQTTKHPKLDVTQFLNAWPKAQPTNADGEQETRIEKADYAHLRIQWELVQLGRAEGCSVWVPIADRNLAYRNKPLREDTIERLPNFGFEENARRIVHNIDVLWLTKNVICKAFEVESTTLIYSGLLRLNDLVLSQPNNRIDLYIVAARARRIKVQNQLLRPSFQSLVQRCEFLAFEDVDNQIKHLEALPVHPGTRVTGLIRGDRFEVPDYYAYPSGV